MIVHPNMIRQLHKIVYRLAKKATPDTSGWDTSKVTDMSYMFSLTEKANPDTSVWNTSNITNMANMFYATRKATPNTSAWDTSSVTNIQSMFAHSLLANPNVSHWDTSEVTNMSGLFLSTEQANPDVSKWDTSKVTNMSGLFLSARQANPDVSKWDTSKVTNMSGMFHSTRQANPDVSKWDTSKVTTMSAMFQKTLQANPDVSKWDTSKVTTMSAMFQKTLQANPDVSNWNTSKVINMKNLFFEARQANPNTSGWDFTSIGAHEGMASIFKNSGLSIDNYSKFLIRLNQKAPVIRTIHKVIEVGKLKYNYSAAISRHILQIKGWTIRDGGLNRQSMTGTSISLGVSTTSPISSSNIANYIISGTCDSAFGAVRVGVVGPPPGVEKDLPCTSQNTFAGSFDLRNIYSAQIAINVIQRVAGGKLETTHSSIFNDSNYFVTKWRFPSNHQFTLPLKEDPSLNYNFTVDWGDGSKGEVTSFNDSDKVHTYATAGDYIIKIVGTCEGFQNNMSASRDRLLEVRNLGNMGWKDLSNAFFRNTHLTSFFGGNTSKVTNMSWMFSSASRATPDTSKWDTSKVTNMSWMFSSAFRATPDTSKWDTSKVTDMRSMFSSASRATPDTSKWDTSKVTDMRSMFSSASRAIPDTSKWDTSKVTDMRHMFLYATQSSPDVSRWNTSGVLNILYMFKGATQANPDTSRWNFTNLSVSDSFDDLFRLSGLSVENYSKFLININAKPPTNINIRKVIHVNTLKYNYSAASARNNLKRKGWIITDGGLDESPRDNNVPWLGLDDSLTLPSPSNRGSYTIHGTCNVNLGIVRVIVGYPSVQKDLPCTEQNTFSGEFDLRNQSSPHMTIRASQDGVSAEASASLSSSPNHFVTKWRFPSNFTFTLPLKSESSLNYNFTVDWGDGLTSEVTSFNDPDKVHTYAAAGNYIIKIAGVCEGFQNDGPSKNMLLEVANLGQVGWKDLSHAFKDNSSLTKFLGGDTSKVTNMSHMFSGASKVTPNTSRWKTSNVTNMEGMFSNSPLAKPDTRGWNTSKVTDMSYMFNLAEKANPDTSSWNTANVTNMKNMFNGANKATPNTSAWDTSSVTNMKGMFAHSLLANPDVSHWDTSEVTDMSGLFLSTHQANPDVSNWDTSKVTDMPAMFHSTRQANPDVSNWDTSKVTNMFGMFQETLQANPDVSHWNTSKVINMTGLFHRAPMANPNTSGWDFTSIRLNEGMASIFEDSGLSIDNYSKFLIRLNQKAPVSRTVHKVIEVGKLKYNYSAAAARHILQIKGWTIRDGGLDGQSMTGTSISLGVSTPSSISSSNIANYIIGGTCNSSLGTVRVVVGQPPSVQKDLPCTSQNTFAGNFDLRNIYSVQVTINASQRQGGSNVETAHSSIFNDTNYFVTKWRFRNNHRFTLPLKSDSSLNYNFTVDWGDGSKGEVTSFNDPDKVHTYATAGNYIIKIVGTLEGFQNSEGTSDNLLEVSNLGNMGWKDLSSAFLRNTHLTSVLGGNTSKVTNMSWMFGGTLQATPDTSKWDTSNVTNMSWMFARAYRANPDTSQWDTSNVTNMRTMFLRAFKANPDTSKWDTSNVTNMRTMFSVASQANPDTGRWDFTNLSLSDSFHDLFRRSNLSVENYSKFLININAKPPTNINIQKVIHVDTLKYNYSAASARNNLKRKGWVITDGGLDRKSLSDNAPWLDLSGSLPPLSSSDGESYTIRGTCNSNLGTVRVIVGDPDVQKDLPCTKQNTFSGTFDLRNQFSPNIIIRANQDGVSAETSSYIVNNLNHFVTKWRFSSNYQFTLPLKSGSSLNYNFTVNWGDGTSSTVTSFNDPDKVHTYARSGDYTIKIVGTCEGFQNDSSSKSYLVEVPNLGNMGWKDLSNAFKGNSFLTHVAGGKTSSVTDMSNMFYDARQTNPDTSGWDTSNVTNMENMFYDARQATPSTGWDTSNVTNMKGMFYHATQAAPDTSGWNTSKVTDMPYMFYNATQANPDTSNWNTSNVTNMNNMFGRAAQADPDTSNWDFRNVTTLSEIFSGSGLSVNSYSDFLVNLDKRIPTSANINKVINVGTLQYNFSAAWARSSLVSQNWSITDGGLSREESINIPWLTIYQPAPLSLNHGGIYRVRGTCNANAGDVTISVGEPNVQKDLVCTENNTFSGNISVQSVVSHPATISASQDRGTSIISESVANEINRFVTKWNIGKPSKTNQKFTLPLKSSAGLKYDFTVDWGDGTTVGTVTSFGDPDKSHTYATGGKYTITITGTIEGFQNNKKTRAKLIEVANLGNMGWKDLSYAFAKNINLVKVRGGNTSTVENMSYMFAVAGQATPDTSGWDTSRVTNMKALFKGVRRANPDTSDWDTSKVTDISYMFYNATQANPDTSDWDTSKVTDTSYMFYSTTQANPDTSDWNISKVADMSYMFHHALQANPDVSQWDTSEVINMKGIFGRSPKANPDTSSWDFRNVTKLKFIFSASGLSTENYSKFLIRFEENTPTDMNSNKVINVGKIQYNSSATSARESLVNHGWSIKDGGSE